MSDALSRALVQHAECVRHGRAVFGGVQEISKLGGFISRLFGQFHKGTEERRCRVLPDSQVGAKPPRGMVLGPLGCDQH